MTDDLRPEDLWERLVHPDELAIMRRMWSDALRTRTPFEFEGRLRRHDGVYRWFMGRTVPVKNDAGQVTRWVGTLTDIEDRKALERDRDAHAADLSLALADRTEQVTRAQQKLAANDRMAAVGTLAAGLGHDLSNLLLPLTVRLEGLLARHDLPVEAREDIQAADALIGHLRALAKNLRMFVRDPSQAGPELATDVEDWAQRVQRFLGVIAGGVDGSDVRVEYDIAAGLPAVAMAPHQLTQAVTNLVHNAREAIAARRLSQGVNAGQGVIRIKAALCGEGGEVCLSVGDDGIGMSDEVRRRCMEPFFTTKDRGTEGARTGTGIGLATVHSAVSHARGRIEVESAPGKGTTFLLHIPIAKPVIRVAPSVRGRGASDSINQPASR